MTCFHCGKEGHVQAKCWDKNGVKPRQTRNQVGPRRYSDVRTSIRTFSVEIGKLTLKDNGDLREYVDTTIVPGSTEKSMLDTGASDNAICPKLLAEYGISDQVDSSKAGFARLANNSIHRMDGEISVKIALGVKEYVVNFKVVPNLSPRIIFGVPFLKESGVLRYF